MTGNRIKIIDKKDCCGCNACREVCPQGCISMRCDSLGCFYPHIDSSCCIDCGLCRRTCPFVNPAVPLLPVECFAAVNEDNEQRLASSSGGVFIELARRALAHRGVVFGAVFTKDWSVKHTYAETMEEVFPMMGSKYVQSDSSDTFRQAKHFLETGREVLYTGTPCQIAGLKHYLGKDHPGLLAVEVICHGAPSPGVWKAYLEETLARPKGVRAGKNTVSVSLKGKPVITGISFRDKRLGWKKFGFDLRLAAEGGEANSVSTSLNTKESYYEPFTENRYMAAFLRNWSLRPSCYACKAKGGSSQADMTIGDFWGIDKTGTIEDDDMGTSCVVCRTRKGEQAMKELQNLSLSPVHYNIIYQGNPSLEESVPLTFSAKRFQRLFPRKGFFRTMDIVENPSFLYRTARFLRKRIEGIFKNN